MKNPWEWDENDLLEKIAAGWKESIDLDFKQSESLSNTDGKKNEISKDVSAFANSAGGTIIYGIAEDENGLIAKNLDAGVDPTITTKEWLEQVINSRVQQRIDGIKIHQVELTIKSPGRVVYVVSIPQSTRAPHQAADKRFYKRFNFQSVAMEEYEIRDVARRTDTPDLRIEFILNPPALTQDINTPHNTSTFNTVSIHAGITNDAIEAANYAVIHIFIDARIEIISASEFAITRNTSLALTSDSENRTHPITSFQLNWNIPAKLPIFQAMFKIASEPLLLKVPNAPMTQQSYLLGYQIQSPRMPTKKAFTFLTVASDTVTLSNNYLSQNELVSSYNTIIWDSRVNPRIIMAESQ